MNKIRSYLKIKHAVKPSADLRRFGILKSDEKSVFELIRKIERDELYAKLTGKTGLPRVITVNRPAGGGFAWANSLEDENFAGAADRFSGGEFLSHGGKVMETIRSIGEEKFEKYFLSEFPAEKKEILRECSINEEEYGRIAGFVAAFLNIYERIPAGNLPEDHFSCLAHIKKTGSGFRVEYSAMHYARGVYRTDMDKLREIKRRGLLSEEECGRLNSFLRTLEIVNCRKKCVYKIMEGLLEFQEEFFRSGKGPAPLSQREFAGRIGVHPSSVSRIIRGKTLVTPQGEKTALKRLFPKKKDAAIDIIARILLKCRNEGKKPGDLEIRDILEKEFSLKVSRRSVNAYRKVLNDDR